MQTQPFKIKSLKLRATDREKMQNFYEQLLGFQLVKETVSSVSYAFRKGEPAFLELEFGGKEASERTTGLFHYAILFPDAGSKAELIDRLVKADYPIGAGDHLVSESFYIYDPEENGIELYHDRDASTWIWENGEVKMATDPVNLEALFLQKKGDFQGYPEGMSIGHLHFTGRQLDEADQFFMELLGAELVSRMGMTAHFYSQNAYHHHFATNLWQGRGIPLRKLEENGILSWTLAVNTDYYQALKEKLITREIPFVEDENGLSLTDHAGSSLIVGIA